jgi:hypothetical protein
MTDLDNDPLAAVFDQFRGEIAPLVHPVGATRTRETVRTRRRKRTVALGALVVVVVAVPVVAEATFAGHPHSGPVPVASASPSFLNSRPRIPPLEQPSAQSTAPAGGISIAELNESKLDVPSWAPDAEAPDCPSGPLQFAKGQTANGDVRVDNVAYADIDHDGRYETIARIYCFGTPPRATSQVVAFTRDSGRGIRSIGQVTAQSGGVAAICTLKAGPGGSVKVEVLDIAVESGCYQANYHGGRYIQEQWRTYAWTGSVFAQSGGPTSFPPNPYVSDLALSSTNLVMARQPNGHYRGTMTQTVRNLGSNSIPYSIEFAVTTGMRPVTPAHGCKVFPALTFGMDTEFSCPGGTLAGGSTRTLKLTFDSPRRVQFDGMPNSTLIVPDTYADLNDLNDQLNFSITFQD